LNKINVDLFYAINEQGNRIGSVAILMCLETLKITILSCLVNIFKFNLLIFSKYFSIGKLNSEKVIFNS
jgi:hypothetical protein